MSWQAMNVVDMLSADACKPLAYRVLVKLANVAAQDGTRAFRFIPEMADELQRSERTIYRALDELEKGMFIRRGDQRHVAAWRGGNRPIVYDLNMGMATMASTIQPLDDEPDRDLTRLSTTDRDLTSDLTSDVNQRELRELSNSSTQGNHSSDVTPGAFVVDNCAVRGRRGHLIDPTSGYCSACGIRSDAIA